jgi:hypothetical protein
MSKDDTGAGSSGAANSERPFDETSFAGKNNDSGFANPLSSRLASRNYRQAFALFDHSSWTVYRPSFLVCHAQMSPISPCTSSYQPAPGIGSVIASQSSCELVDVRASKTESPPVQPLQPGYGITA